MWSRFDGHNRCADRPVLIRRNPESVDSCESVDSVVAASVGRPCVLRLERRVHLVCLVLVHAQPVHPAIELSETMILQRARRWISPNGSAIPDRAHSSSTNAPDTVLNEERHPSISKFNKTLEISEETGKLYGCSASARQNSPLK